MRLESFGWPVAATSFYVLHLLISLAATGVIDYSPYDFVLGVTLGLLLVLLAGAFLAGVAIITHEAAARQPRPWL